MPKTQVGDRGRGASGPLHETGVGKRMMCEGLVHGAVLMAFGRRVLRIDPPEPMRFGRLFLAGETAFEKYPDRALARAQNCTEQATKAP